MTVRTCISRLERILESDELPPSEDSERNEFSAPETLNGRVAAQGDLDAATGVTAGYQDRISRVTLTKADARAPGQALLAWAGDCR